jgi:Fur family ferric uptake transcriptional regulator
LNRSSTRSAGARTHEQSESAVERATREFAAYLRSQGLRLTRQRRDVLEETSRRADHFSAEELYASLRQADADVSLPTIYRTLAHLDEAGLVRQVLRQHGSAHYESNLEQQHHDHMICVECGRIIEFLEPGIERLQQKVCRRHDFQPLYHRMGIRGICASCQERTPEETGEE